MKGRTYTVLPYGRAPAVSFSQFADALAEAWRAWWREEWVASRADVEIIDAHGCKWSVGKDGVPVQMFCPAQAAGRGHCECGDVDRFQVQA